MDIIGAEYLRVPKNLGMEMSNILFCFFEALRERANECAVSHVSVEVGWGETERKDLKPTPF